MNVFIESRTNDASAMQVASVRRFVAGAGDRTVTAHVRPSFTENDLMAMVDSSPPSVPGLFLSNGVVVVSEVNPFNGIAMVAGSFRPLVLAWTDKSLLTYFGNRESPFSCDFEPLQQQAISPECGRLRRIGQSFVTPNSPLGIPVKSERPCWNEVTACGNTAWKESKPCLAGTHLKRLLAGPPFWLSESNGCGCSSHAQKMDLWGCDECERREGEIVGWLRQEAARRGLPFFDAAGKMLVRIAIARARNDSGAT